MPPLLNAIDSSEVGYTATGSDFAGLVASMLGNTGDNSDGWDQDMAAILETFPQTDAALADLDATADEVDSGVAAFSALDVAGTLGDMVAPPPSLALDVSGPVLNPVGGASLPAPPTAPAPPPTVCVPQTTPVQPRPPRPGRWPLPPPLPPTPTCPDGQYFSPTLGHCQPTDSPPPPPPPTSDPGPRPLPVPPLSPCPSGFVYDPSIQDCVPQPSGSGTPGVTWVAGQIIPGTAETAAQDLSVILAYSLGVPTWLIQAIPIFGQVVSAFLTFNSLFGGSFDAQLAAYAAEMAAWQRSAPVALEAYLVQQKIQEIQSQLGVGGEFMPTLEQQQQMLADLQMEYDALQACIAAGQFNSCPPYV